MQKTTNKQQVPNQKVAPLAMAAIDWSLLLPELLHIICTKLTDIGDFIRFRAVCKAWRSSVSLSDPSPRLPWIYVIRESQKTVDIQFYSYFSYKTYTINVPQLSDAYIMGTTGSSLLICKGIEESLSLLNPLVTNEISLPPLKGKIRHPIRYSVFRNPVIIRKDQIMILGMNSSDIETLSLVVSQPADGHWTVTNISATFERYGAWAYYKGMCFVSRTPNEHTMVIDAITGNVLTTIPDFKIRNNDEVLDYLVESGGKLLRILIHNYKNPEQLSLDVYALGVQEKGYRWLEIKDIDNHILFLDTCGGFSLTSSEFHGLRGNCIYFFTYLVDVNNEVSKCLLHRYELGNGNIEILPYPFRSCGTWIIPSMC